MAHLPAPERYDRMPYRRCGRSGLRLPVISLGAAFETIGGRMDFTASREALCAAFDLGITHFDLANNYGAPAGNAETVVGRVLRELPRDEIVISTKAGFRMGPGPYGIGLSKKYLAASLDQSLRRLGLEYVDLFYAHTPDEETPIEETIDAFGQLVRQGKALYVGVANFSGPQFAAAADASRAAGGPPITIHQTPYNILARGAETALFPQLQARGTGCAAFYVLGQGVLTGKYRGGHVPPDTRVANLWGEKSRKVGLAPAALAQIDRLAQLAETRGQTLAQTCIAWVLQHPAVTTAVLGASRVDQIRDNVKAIEGLTFSEEERRFVDSVSPAP